MTRPEVITLHPTELAAILSAVFADRDARRERKDALWAKAYAANRSAQQAVIDGADPTPLRHHAEITTARAQEADAAYRSLCGALGGCGHEHTGDWLTVVPEQREGR